METKTKMMNEYHEKLKKHPEAVKNYYDSLTDAQRVQLEAARQEKKTCISGTEKNRKTCTAC